MAPSAAESPTSRSYWVVEDRLLAGAYPSHVESKNNDWGPAQGRRDAVVDLTHPSTDSHLKPYKDELSAWTNSVIVRGDAEAGVRLLQQLIDAGVDAVVDLTQRLDPASTDSHLRPYEDDLERLAPSSVLVRHPILDLNIPTEDEMVAALDTIDRLLDEGRTVYVHCWGGIGRTGTVVGSWLVRHGVTAPEQALDLLTELRASDRGAGHRRSPETHRTTCLRAPVATGRDSTTPMPPTEEVHDSPTGWVNQHIKSYVESDGKQGHRWHGVDTLLLTTRGRKTGKLRRSALIYGQDGDSYVIVASKGGSEDHPAWYLNLVADPDVEVQIEAETFAARASTAGGPRRERLWRMMAEIWPDYVKYQRRTERQIPVIVLERV